MSITIPRLHLRLHTPMQMHPHKVVRNLPSHPVMNTLNDPPERVELQFIVNGCYITSLSNLRVLRSRRGLYYPYHQRPTHQVSQSLPRGVLKQCKEPSERPCNALLRLHGLDVHFF